MTEYPNVDASEDDWDVSDLDRCKHGRHSIDPCMYCPGGVSSGNQFLPVLAGQHSTGELAGEHPVRIGTTLSGDPIAVRPKRRAWPLEPGPDLRLDHGQLNPMMAPGDEITISDRTTGWVQRFRVIEPLDSAVRIEPIHNEQAGR